MWTSVGFFYQGTQETFPGSQVGSEPTGREPTEVDQKVGLSRNRVHRSTEKRRSVP